MNRIGLLALVLMGYTGCERTEERVVHRENCLVCHQPRGDDGIPHGIEDAHPFGLELACVDCHGGEPWVCDTGSMGTTPDGRMVCNNGSWVYDKDQAHVSPGDGPVYLRNLSAAELDNVSLEYLRFINPGDLRVVDTTCGVCHAEEVDRVRRSTMAHTSGELTVARYRAEAQPDPHGVFSAVDVQDPDVAEASACAVAELMLFEPEAPTTEPLTVATAQDQYMAKSCLRCHLNDFGENRFTADFRSSGCTACHMTYADDGLSLSDDPRINKESTPHPIRHEITTTPPTDQCTHCHYRGGRIGISYQGYRESAGPGLNPDDPVVLGVAQHGHDAAYYLVDEDNGNSFDETPPDLHFEAGMHCVDCHLLEEVHGDGHLYADTQCAITTECEDCHGTVRERAQLDPARDNLFERDGEIYLRTRVTDMELLVPQTIGVVTEGSPTYTELAHQAMGVSAGGFSHTDEIECYTCHAAWTPSCYGCHVELDMTRMGRIQSTGELTIGQPTGGRRWVVLNDMVLLRNSDGKLAPSMPSERFFMTVREESGPTEVRSAPRSFTFPDGRTIAAFGQRAFNPHTTRRRSAFMACDRCHSVGDATTPLNEVLLDLTHGFGTQRFLEQGCDITNADTSCDPATDFTTYALDAVQTRTGEPLVVVGHPDPMVSRVLSLEEIAAMRAIVVGPDEAIRTEIPADAMTNTRWPFAAPSR